MTQITISDGHTTVTMPRVKAIQVGGKEEAKKVTMASGRIVKYVLGHRATVTASWDWVPADTITALSAMLRAGGFFSVEYPGPDGDGTGKFSIPYPAMGVFAFQDGTPIWHDVKLTMEAQEVS